MKTFRDIVLLAVPFLPVVIVVMILLEVSSKLLSWSLFTIFVFSVVVFIIYINQLIKIKLDKQKKFTWVVFFLLFPNLAEIVFWFKHINHSK